MIIKKLRINGYGKFTNKEINIKTGLNVVFGKNEAGKSTLQSFINAMLFDFPRKNMDKEGRLPEQKKYKPWNSNVFGGIMEIQTDNKRILKIERDFTHKNASVFDSSLRDVTSEFPYSKKDGLSIGETLLNMDRECFENTSFIKQGGSVVLQDDRKNLFEKLMNLSSTGSENTSAVTAQNALSSAATELGNSRTKNKPYNIAMAEYNRLSFELDNAKRKRKEMSVYSDRKLILENDIKVLSDDFVQYESAMELNRLIQEKTQLLRLKNKYDGFAIDVQKLGDDILNAEQQLNKYNIPQNITESDILENIKKAATAVEKQKSLTCTDPESELIKLGKNIKRKRILIALSYLGVTVTALLAILFNFGIFGATAIFTVGLIYMHLKKYPYSEDELRDQMKIKKECFQDSVMIKSFLESAGLSGSDTFEEAGALLNELFKRKKQSAELENQLIRQKERKSDLEKFKTEVLGQYDDITQIEMLLKNIDIQINKSKISADKAMAIVGVNPQTALSEKQRELSGVVAVLNEYLQSDEEIADIEESLEFYKEKLDSILTELRALEIASENISISAEKMQKDILPRLNEKTGAILEKVTDGNHLALFTSIDNDMNTEYQNSVHSLWEFSDGTIDQMYFSLRVAASEVFSEKESVPIIIDEAFAYYDENRIRSTFDFLNELAKDRQILVFTCKEKEIDFASEYKDVNIIRI